MTRSPAALRLGAAVACLVAGCAAVAVAASSTGKGVPLLPNIDQAAPADLRVRTVLTSRGLAYRLGFTSRIENNGDGPLIIRSTRTGKEVMSADQIVALRGGGRRTRRRGVGSVRYVRTKGHEHWHVMGLQRFALRTLGGRTLSDTVRKQGLCLGDRSPATDLSPPAVFRASCGLERPRLGRLEQGLSPGWTDPYPPRVEGQEIDITRLRGGYYQLVHRGDPYKRIAESDESDNAASVAIAVTRPPAVEPPRVEVLRECPDASRCPP